MRNFEEIKSAAYASEDLPDGAAMPERCAWWELREIYRRYRSGEIDRALGRRLMAEVNQQYQADQTMIYNLERIRDRSAAMWAEIEKAGSEYALSENRSPEADRLWEAIYNVKIRKEEDEQ